MDNSTVYILSEGVLNDNLLRVPDNGYVLKGGYIAAVIEYIYRNEWSNREVVKRFRSRDRLVSYLERNYPDFDVNLAI